MALYKCIIIIIIKNFSLPTEGAIKCISNLNKSSILGWKNRDNIIKVTSDT